MDNNNEQKLQEELEKLKAENQLLKSKKSGAKTELTFRVSQKGAVSVYGMGRFPVTLYKEQWERLLSKSSELLEFIEANGSKLATR